MKQWRLLLLPFSWIYGAVLAVRNLCYDVGLFQQNKIDIPVIAVGNLSVGGTGKTPHVTFIVDALCDEFTIAILLRGYGRSTKGYLRVGGNATSQTVGDEALYYKMRYGSRVEVIVCENRFEGAKRMCEQFPALNLIVLDDAFQHRGLARSCNIVLDDFTRPIHQDFVLPAGNLREFRCGIKRADIVVVTKVPRDIPHEELSSQLKKRMMKPHQTLFSSSISYNEIVSWTGEKATELPAAWIVVTGIGNPQPMVDYFSTLGEVKHLQFSDHHNYSAADLEGIHEIFDKFAHVNKAIVTTEKDAMRLRHPKLIKLVHDYPWFIQRMNVEINTLEMDLIKAIRERL